MSEPTHTFIKNKYTNWYYSIINNAKNRNYYDGYTEKHHIIPKSLGGDNNITNIVKLTPKEHFIVHKLLTKMTIGKDKYKMSFALYCMMNMNFSHISGNRNVKISSRQFTKIKELHIELVRKYKSNYRYIVEHVMDDTIVDKPDTTYMYYDSFLYFMRTCNKFKEIVKEYKPNWLSRRKPPGRKKECGKDITGLHVGKLTVISKSSRDYYWICKCACGNHKEVYQYDLTTNNVSSCGCFKADHLIKKAQKENIIKYNLLKKLAHIKCNSNYLPTKIDNYKVSSLMRYLREYAPDNVKENIVKICPLMLPRYKVK